MGLLLPSVLPGNSSEKEWGKGWLLQTSKLFPTDERARDVPPSKRDGSLPMSDMLRNLFLLSLLLSVRQFLGRLCVV